MSFVITAIAVYGAVLSTVAVIWQVFTWRDRRIGRIRVTVKDNMMFLHEDDYKEGPLILFTAVNDGQKPITLEKLCVEVKGEPGGLYVKCVDLPRTLAESEEYDQRSDQASFLQELQKMKVKPPWKCTAVFCSNTGRKYRKNFVIKP